MKLENQVCSLKLAKRLKELGVKQESYFWWWRPIADNEVWNLDPLHHLPVAYQNKEYPTVDNIWFGAHAAFTVAELGEMLPADIYGDDIYSHKLTNHISKKHWFRCSYKDNNWWVDLKTEAEARAAMLIYLLENKLISL